MDIGAADHWDGVDAGVTHALQGKRHGVIGMDVRKGAVRLEQGIDSDSVILLFIDLFQCNDAFQVVRLAYRPGVPPLFLQLPARFGDLEFGRQRIHVAAHDLADAQAFEFGEIFPDGKYTPSWSASAS